MQHRLAIVIPSHARPDLLRSCLASVQEHQPAECDVLVVDDASAGGAVSAAAAEFHGVRSLRLASRGGFCVATNAGINHTDSEFIEVLNDDTEVCPFWAEAAVACFADPHIGAVAPLVLYRNADVGATQCVDSAGDAYFVGGFAQKQGHGESLGPHHLTPRPVFGASASSAFYRRAALDRVDLFPERFGAYFEDIDLAFRLHRAGYGVHFEPASRVFHHVSATHGALSSAALLEQQSCNEELVYLRNLPARALLRGLPLHVAVLLAKAWRRWREGRLLPFLRGRLRAFLQIVPLLSYRRRLRRLGPDVDPKSWNVE